MSPLKRGTMSSSSSYLQNLTQSHRKLSWIMGNLMDWAKRLEVVQKSGNTTPERGWWQGKAWKQQHNNWRMRGSRKQLLCLEGYVGEHLDYSQRLVEVNRGHSGEALKIQGGLNSFWSQKWGTMETCSFQRCICQPCWPIPCNAKPERMAHPTIA